jgi:CO dehydrogenase/acetyl-CoA synthase alpha subunit
VDAKAKAMAAATKVARFFPAGSNGEGNVAEVGAYLNNQLAIIALVLADLEEKTLHWPAAGAEYDAV